MKKSDGKKASVSKASAKKVVAKTSKTPVAVKKPAKKKKVVPPTLSSADRSAKLKPPENYTSIVEQVVTSWDDHKQVLRIEGRTPKRLSSLFEKAKKARTKEEALKKAYERALHKLVDARLLVEDQMWGDVLDIYRVAKAMTPIHPQLEKAFDKMADYFSRPRAPQTPSTPPPPGVGILRDADLEDE